MGEVKKIEQANTNEEIRKAIKTPPLKERYGMPMFSIVLFMFLNKK